MVMRKANKEKWTEKRKAAEDKAIAKVEQKTAEAVADNAVTLERIKAKLLCRLEMMLDEYPKTNAAEVRFNTKSVITTYRMKDIAAVYAALENKTAAGRNADIEDLSPLVELLRDE